LGEWTPRFDRLVEDQPQGHPVHAVEFDTTGLGARNVSLLILLVQARNHEDYSGWGRSVV